MASGMLGTFLGRSAGNEYWLRPNMRVYAVQQGRDVQGVFVATYHEFRALVSEGRIPGYIGNY